MEQLRATHHAILFACGAESDRRLGLPNEDLAGSHTATEFVGWYNGHPDYRDRSFDLSQEVVVVIGQGNVAIDVARILAKPIDELRATDMAEHALDALAGSRVRDIHIIGRRGPAQASFTFKELRELGDLAGCVTIVSGNDLRLNSASLTELEDKNNFNAAKNVEILQSWTTHCTTTAEKRIWFHFLRSPVASRGLAGSSELRSSEIPHGPRLGNWPKARERWLTLTAGCYSAALATAACRCRGCHLSQPGECFPVRPAVLTACTVCMQQAGSSADRQE